MKQWIFASALIAASLTAVQTGKAASSDATTANSNSTNSQVCKAATEQEIASLFERWDASLGTLNPEKVVENYAQKSILVPTVSNKVRFSAAEKADYFAHFLQNKPRGVINQRMIQIGCNTAFDSGLYTFTYGTTGQVVEARYTFTYGWDGEQWLITSHHSSGMPEKANTMH